MSREKPDCRQAGEKEEVRGEISVGLFEYVIMYFSRTIPGAKID